MLQIQSDKEGVIGYAWRVKRNAEERVKRIKKAFGSFMEDEKWYEQDIILTTWSDGRFENKSHEWLKSNIEFTIIENNQKRNTPLVKTPQELCGVIQRNVSFIIDNLEIKKLWEDSLILYENNQNLVFPTRIWDAFPIWWDDNLYCSLRRMISQEIIDNPKLNEHFYRRLKVHKKAAKQWFSTFKQQTATQFDLEKWKLYYDPKNYNEWVKYWPLRVIQYSLALSLLRKIRNLWTHPDFVDILPTNIIERIDFLVSNNLTRLSPNEAEEIKYIYAYFLKIYHQIQFDYAFLDKTEFNIWSDDIKDIQKMLHYLAESFSVERLIK